MCPELPSKFPHLGTLKLREGFTPKSEKRFYDVVYWDRKGKLHYVCVYMDDFGQTQATFIRVPGDIPSPRTTFTVPGFTGNQISFARSLEKALADHVDKSPYLR